MIKLQLDIFWNRWGTGSIMWWMLAQLLLRKLKTQQPVCGRWPGAKTNIVSWTQTELSWVFVYSHWPWLWVLHSVVTLLNGFLRQSSAMPGPWMYSALGMLHPHYTSLPFSDAVVNHLLYKLTGYFIRNTCSLMQLQHLHNSFHTCPKYN